VGEREPEPAERHGALLAQVLLSADRRLGLLVQLRRRYPGFFAIREWAFTADAFQKAMVWSTFWELAGFGCGWGPMNARFDPWFGGFRHFLRRERPSCRCFGVPR
jgi:hypothetical protein